MQLLVFSNSNRIELKYSKDDYYFMVFLFLIWIYMDMYVLDLCVEAV